MNYFKTSYRRNDKLVFSYRDARGRFIKVDMGKALEEMENSFVNDMVEALMELGYRAMMYAYGMRTFQHVTHNLHDSYATAVYVNGELIKHSIQYVGNPQSTRTDHKTHLNGRQTVQKWLENHHYGQKNKQIVVVVIAAMYYTKYLEGGGENMGGRGPGGSFIVISPARKFINQHYNEYVGRVWDKYKLSGKPNAKVVKATQPIYADE